jgi:phosphatidylglycerol:prolipoprotein diacylglycerol transferase
MFINNLDPVLFSIGPVSIRWYGVLYLLGVLFVYWYVRREIMLGRLSTTVKRFDDVYFWVVVGCVLGARLFEVLFYDPSYYFANPLKILAVWEGGLSFHGALIGVILVLVWWCKKDKLSFWQVADLFIVPAALGQCFGRLGNFFNSELVGLPFNGPWAVIYAKIDEVPRHPVQIYEILYNLIIFFVLLAMKKKSKPGQLFATFLILYGAFRFIVEYFKTPEVVWGFLTIGQWLSVLMVVAGVWLWYSRRK